MATKKKHGGRRPGSGAKPKKDKKQPVFLYLKESTIENNGGKEALKEKLETQLEKT